MKKKLSIFVIMMMILFTGCDVAECISTEYEEVTVKIVDSYHSDQYTTYQYCGKVLIPIVHHEINQITVEYDSTDFILDDEYSYDLYHTNTGEDVTAVLRISKYDNGDITREIISLK